MKKKAQSIFNRPRLYVFKSNKHIYAQIIDHKTNKILCGSSSISKDLQLSNNFRVNCIAAYKIGQNIAYKAGNIGINEVVFDRGHHIYHGQIKSLAEGARKEGIKF